MHAIDAMPATTTLTAFDAPRHRQALYEAFTADLELRVYSAGVQMHVKRHLKQLESMFYGASLAYDTALAGQAGSLPEALLKNVYGGDSAKKGQAEAMARYALWQLENLRATDSAALLGGRLRFVTE